MAVEIEKEFYNVFLIEDEKTDQIAFERVIDREGLPYKLTIASTVDEAKTILQGENNFDIIILDYMLNDRSAFEIMNLIKFNKTPVIFHTAAGSEEVAIKALQLGVSDYLIKDTNYNYLKVLPFSIEKAIQQKHLENELRDLAILHDSILRNSFDAFAVCDSEGKVYYTNDAFSYLSKYTNEEIKKLKISDLLIGKEFTSHFISAAKNKNDLMNVWTNLRPKSGSDIPVAISVKYIIELDKILFTAHDLRVSPEMKTEVKHFRKFAANNIKTVLYKMSSTGPTAVISEKLEFNEIDTKELLLKMGIYYSTAIAQGESGKNTVGLFGPFPIPKKENYIALVYSFFITDKDADERYNGKTYAFLVFILPKSLEQLFSNRFSISRIAREILSEYEKIEDLDLDLLLRLKKTILQIEVN